MRIADICCRSVAYVKGSEPVRNVAELMRRRHVGTVVVIDQPNGNRVPTGIITDRDIVLAIVAKDLDASMLVASDIMTRAPMTCIEEEDLFDAVRMMKARGVRRLPVVSSKGDLVGIVSSDDIQGVLGTIQRDLGQVFTREQVREMEKNA
ncbi:hypothetical protein AB839_03135 [Stenotrophomonas sp. DDT-1]|uniref:CBS domain-containing protein n=1 Tax=Stenotrophomonas sp. DDT-1 TaxID=1609637 RepID=UPI00077815E1|nr:CBS domain-containing protein [Stenotrophomonas sp. DDT-1]KXU98395.1 hypothetical protein AB839_03135 [Stenotrophomonas sp. DDT-1]